MLALLPHAGDVRSCSWKGGELQGQGERYQGLGDVNKMQSKCHKIFRTLCSNVMKSVCDKSECQKLLPPTPPGDTQGHGERQWLAHGYADKSWGTARKAGAP